MITRKSDETGSSKGLSYPDICDSFREPFNFFLYLNYIFQRLKAIGINLRQRIFCNCFSYSVMPALLKIF